MKKTRQVHAFGVRLLQCLGFAAMFVALPTLAVLPENGIYSNGNFPGRGYIIERQGNVVSVGVYAYNEQTKQSEWYLATGALRDDADEVPGEDPLPQQGYYPIHSMSGTLFRFRNGPCLICANVLAGGVPVPPDAERVGTLSLFVDYLKTPTIRIEADAGVILSDLTFENVEVTRTNFARPSFGNDGSSKTVDLSGRWLFDRPGETPIALTLGPAQVTDVGAQRVPPLTPMLAYTLRYEDPTAGAVVLCRVFHHVLASAPTYGNAPKSGCEFSVGGSVKFSALRDDIGIDELAAFEGPLPSFASDVLRGPLVYRGVRRD